MRNMYDYAYEYEYQYHPERAGEMFAVVFASLWLAIMIGMLVFMLGSYLLHSFGLYTIALNVLVNKQIYENFAEGNMPVIHAVLSSLVPLYEAICLFIMRKRPFVR